MYNIGKMKKKLLILCLSCVLCLTACGTNECVEAEAEKIVEAVINKDMQTVEAIICGTGNLITDEELAGFFDDSESANNGIIAKIVGQDSITVKEITDEYIMYEITTPELSNIFKDVMKEDLTEESFEEYIYNYITTAEKTKIEVRVPYIYEDDVFKADYSTQEFVNGITGNLITAYQDLIQQMIQENGEVGVK